MSKLQSAAAAISEFSWTPPQELVDACTKIGFVLGIIWVLFILFQFALPSKQGGGRKLSRIGVMGFLGAGALIVLLFNIKQLPDIVNWIIGICNWVVDLFVSIG
jgi:hypothetical protein